MEILPLSHRDMVKEGFDVKAPKEFQPTCVLAWVRGDDGEKALVWSRRTETWLLADGVSPAEPLPRAEQMKVSRLMRRTLMALERGFATAKRVVVEEDDDDERS